MMNQSKMVTILNMFTKQKWSIIINILTMIRINCVYNKKRIYSSVKMLCIPFTILSNLRNYILNMV